MDRRVWQEPFEARVLGEGIQLARGDLMGIRRGRGALVFLNEGVVWLTQDGDAGDHVITRGTWFRLGRDGVAYIQALRPAAVTVTAPADALHVEVFRPEHVRAEPTRRQRGHPLARMLLACWVRMHRFGRRAVAARTLTWA